MVLLEMSLTPLGKGESVSEYVARCVEVVRGSGLAFELHAMGTIIEGELPDVLEVLRRCFEVLSADCDRITCSAKFDYRQGAGGRIQSKVLSVQQKLADSQS
ncbi:MAG: MTH1187 family thiamine-binding protein [Planctomycetales bacterium]|nr:MTH1187 family thiamine-binding protein [Planctomycetales bacterium]